jgi:hypothetical protein
VGVLYRELDIGVRYEPSEFSGSATVTMRVANECVRGDLRTDQTAASWQVNLAFRVPFANSTAHRVTRFVTTSASASGS